MFKTNLDQVKAVVGDEAYESMTEAGYSILWADSIRAWRGFRGATYIRGSNATLKEHGTDEQAINKVLVAQKMVSPCFVHFLFTVFDPFFIGK